MTFVFVGSSALFWEYLPSKIEVIGVPGIYIYIFTESSLVLSTSNGAPMDGPLRFSNRMARAFNSRCVWR